MIDVTSTSWEIWFELVDKILSWSINGGPQLKLINIPISLSLSIWLSKIYCLRKMVMGTMSFVRHYCYYHSSRLRNCTFYSAFTTEIDLRDYFTECRCISSRVMHFGYRYVCSSLFVVDCLELLLLFILTFLRNKFHKVLHIDLARTPYYTS